MFRFQLEYTPFFLHDYQNSRASLELYEIKRIPFDLIFHERRTRWSSEYSASLFAPFSVFQMSGKDIHRYIRLRSYLQRRIRACVAISCVRYSRHVQRGAALRITPASLFNIRVRRRWCRVIGVPYSLQELPGQGYLSNTVACKSFTSYSIKLFRFTNEFKNIW